MLRVISSERVPIKMWLTDIEDGALEQAKNLANLPFAFKHIPIMPDSHQGYGMPIGSILATKDVVVPNAVGVDIGCGMCALPTQLTDITTADLKRAMGEARQRIPLGFNWHEEAQDESWMPEGAAELPIVSRHYVKARKQVGSLGGGNHFIEIQKGSDGRIWLMIHSGSRNLGYNVAKFYNERAIALNEILETRQLRGAHRPAGMHLAGRNPDLGPHPELATICELRRGVAHQDCAVEFGKEPPGRSLILGQDTVGVA